LIGQRVRKLREERGLSQVELGRRAGLDNQTISDLERGVRGAKEPRVSTVQALADALQVPITDLLGDPEGAATFP
jgi:transcriptional regulator with XRE-family HTH domain